IGYNTLTKARLCLSIGDRKMVGESPAVLPPLLHFVETVKMAEVRARLVEVLSGLKPGKHSDESLQLMTSYDKLAETQILPLRGQEYRSAQAGLMMAKSEIFRLAKWFAYQDEKWDEAWEQAALENQEDEFRHSV